MSQKTDTARRLDQIRDLRIPPLRSMEAQIRGCVCRHAPLHDCAVHGDVALKAAMEHRRISRASSGGRVAVGTTLLLLIGAVLLLSLPGCIDYHNPHGFVYSKRSAVITTSTLYESPTGGSTVYRVWGGSGGGTIILDD